MKFRVYDDKNECDDLIIFDDDTFFATNLLHQKLQNSAFNSTWVEN